MSRYIDADDSRIDLDERGFDFFTTEHDIDEAQRWLDEQPTQDVEPVIHAYWEEECRTEITFPSGDSAMLIERRCSNCQLWSNKEIPYYYPKPAKRCSNCGAKMDGKENTK